MCSWMLPRSAVSPTRRGAVQCWRRHPRLLLAGNRLSTIAAYMPTNGHLSTRPPLPAPACTASTRYRAAA